MCMDLINETIAFLNCTLEDEARRIDVENCSGQVSQSLCTNSMVCDSDGPDLDKGVTILIVLILSLLGNVSTIAILTQFKVHKIPDVLVVGLALTDLLTTLVPIPLATYAYFAGVDYTQGCILCDFFGTMAQFTRYSSSQIVTIVSVERYLAVNRPFLYRKYATPKRFVAILVISWLLALLLAAIPLMDEGTEIHTHDGFCLFDITSPYGIAILVYSGIMFVTVFGCFLLVSVELIKVYRRRKKLKVQDQYNSNSRAARFRQRSSELTFTRPNLTSR